MARTNRFAGSPDELECLASDAGSSVAALRELLQQTEELRRYLARAEVSGRRLDPMICSDDISQEVALEVVTSIHRFDRDRGRFAAWLTGITRHVISRRSRQRPSASMPDSVQPSQLAAVALRETLSTVDLMEHERRLLSMIAVGGTIRDVAESMEITEAAASKRIQRLRARLQQNATER